MFLMERVLCLAPINRNSLNEIPILIPSSKKLDEFEALVAPMDAADSQQL